MKNVYSKIAAVSALVLLFAFPSMAQVSAEGFKIGIQGNMLLPSDEFYWNNGLSSYELSYLGRGFIRFNIIKRLEVEIGGGYGTYAGKDYADSKYETNIMPIDLRFVVSPWQKDNWNPFFYAGFGAMKYEVKTFPSSRSAYPVEAKDWTTMYPIGVGGQFGLSENILFEVTLGFTYTLTENLNYYNKPNSGNDGYFSLGLGLTFQGDRSNSDDDKDGLIQKDEKSFGTDPKNPDTDGDGVKDGDEVHLYKTDPLKTDSDGDGLSDGSEVNTFKSNPANGDTDGDGLTDGDEVNKYRSDPLKADTDGDGLTDGDEVNRYKSDPAKEDTDLDDLTDGAEVNQYKTNPTKADTDGDGLNDGEEINQYKTDPTRADTDSGTINDGVEVNRGTDPLDAEDDVVKVGVPIILEGVTFETGKYNITPESAKVLEGALKTLQTYPDIQVEIAGYTDNVGSKSFNISLSQKRAASVKNWLVEHGIDATRIDAVGYGPDNPVAPNDSPDNRRKNRRIEFKRTK